MASEHGNHVVGDEGDPDRQLHLALRRVLRPVLKGGGASRCPWYDRQMIRFLSMSSTPLVLLVLLACPPTRGLGEPPDVEICGDGEDNDGDGQVDEGFDADADGFFGCGSGDPDCDDGDAAVHPGAAEDCDDIDDDCDGEIDEDCGADDDDSLPIEPFLVEMHPAPGDDGFFVGSSLWVEFDRAPDSVGMSLAGPGGSPVAASTSQDASGRVHTLDPEQDLLPLTAYTLTVAWSPSEESPLHVPFTTGEHGLPVEDPSLLVGRTFAADLAGGTWVQPPGTGPIIASQLDGLAVLLAATAESDLDGGMAHVMAVMGQEDGGSYLQDPCEETWSLTAGADGIVGTSDDSPGTWQNPRITTGPSVIRIVMQGTPTTVQDAWTDGVFAPDLSDQQGGVFAGLMDTRPLAVVLDPGGGEGAMCDLMEETLGVGCVECGPPNPGEFCLTLRVQDVVSVAVPGLELVPIGCADVIQRAVDGYGCDQQASAYDQDQDGTYELCPSF